MIDPLISPLVFALFCTSTFVWVGIFAIGATLPRRELLALWALRTMGAAFVLSVFTLFLWLGLPG